MYYQHPLFQYIITRFPINFFLFQSVFWTCLLKQLTVNSRKKKKKKTYQFIETVEYFLNIILQFDVKLDNPVKLEKMQMDSTHKKMLTDISNIPKPQTNSASVKEYINQLQRVLISCTNFYSISEIYTLVFNSYLHAFMLI